MNSEQRLHNQKYSTSTELPAKVSTEGACSESASNRKSLPSWRERNNAEHDGLAHLANIQDPFPYSMLNFLAVARVVL